MKTVIIGLQYGDEGKGRVSGLLAPNYDWAVRFNGGPNAGHTVYKDGKEYKFHHLPAGALFGKKVALDTGMVIDYVKLLAECEAIDFDYSNLYISQNVNLILDKHVEADAEGSGLGSTKKGIAYVYADRALRHGARVERCGWLEPKEKKQTRYKGLPPIGKYEHALYEGAQGIMLDVDYGAYPYVTSSNIFPSMIHDIDYRIGVMKAYTTRVGDGPPYYDTLPWLSQKGKEIGTTTGRTRKAYWLIIDDLKYAISLYQPDEIVVTKVDILEDVKEIKVWENGQEKTIGNIDSYLNYLKETFPQIKRISKSPHGPLIDL